MKDIYKDIFFKHVKGDIEKKENQYPATEHWQCYVALNYASEAKLVKAQKILTHLDDKNHYCSIVLETKTLIAYFSRNKTDVHFFGLEALKTNQKAVFAYAVLARVALSQKQETKAIEYYEKILSVYPEHDGILLNMADILHKKKETLHLAKEYVNQAKPSLRRSLYQLLLPILSMRVRFKWLIPVILILIIPTLGKWFYIVTTLLIFSGIVWAAKKYYLLIVNQLLIMQLVHSFFWVMVLFFKWLIKIVS